MTLALRRLAAQQLVRPTFTDPAALVRWLGVVQAQDPAGARWALGLRLAGPPAVEETILQALANGSLLRTHVLRWTWQLITPADLRWMLSLVAARLIDSAAGRHRQLDLDAATFRRSHTVLTRTLRGGAQLTRAELAAALRGAGIAITGPRLSHLLGYAELAGVLCSGAARGKQATWALLDERVPAMAPHTPKDRPAAVAELAERYFCSRGPATVADFAWWSGLPVREARSGVEAAAAGLTSTTLGDVRYFHAARARPGRAVAAAAPSFELLPPFDEYLVAYRDRSAVLDPARARRVNDGGGMLNPCVLRDGQVIGTWRRTLTARTVAVDVGLFAPVVKGEAALIRAAADRYGAFIGRAVTVTFARRPR